MSFSICSSTAKVLICSYRATIFTSNLHAVIVVVLLQHTSRRFSCQCICLAFVGVALACKRLCLEIWLQLKRGYRKIYSNNEKVVELLYLKSARNYV